MTVGDLIRELESMPKETKVMIRCTRWASDIYKVELTEPLMNVFDQSIQRFVYIWESAR
jgi:hypothetical protein